MSRMTDEQYRRWLEVRYLVLEHDVTPADHRPPSARIGIAGWRRELEHLTRLARLDRHAHPEDWQA